MAREAPEATIFSATYSPPPGHGHSMAADVVSLFHDDDKPALCDRTLFREKGPSNTTTTSGLDSAERPPQSRASCTISRLLKGKEREWAAVSKRSRPLTLLELPVDVLRLIVKEVTHTNDLTALALTNSTLYNLAVPQIYARFDIVWPDTQTTAPEGKSVDALTYGLSTLCLGSTFAKTTYRLRKQGLLGRFGRGDVREPKYGGADYAKYTRKFSLGNGPPDWVAEYLITKESGKMLGTLVAMAVAKMANLEAFMWDMPTGVLSDIFMSLASLPDLHPNGECKLDRLWIRWHDNNELNIPSSSTTNLVTTVQQQAVVPLGSTLTPIGILLPSNASHPKPRAKIPYSESHVEFPTFSVVPPVSSLTVLDVDELSYLDEMSILIERSKDRLKELRIGVSAKAMHKDFVQTWDGADLEQIDHDARWPGESTIGERRLGGVLGVLVGRIYDIRRKINTKPRETVAADSEAPPSGAHAHEQTHGSDDTASDGMTDNVDGHVSMQRTALDNPENQTSRQSVDLKQLKTPNSTLRRTSEDAAETTGRRRLEGKLRLETLEMERINLSIQVCCKALDWTTLTNLTILDCSQHENLWKLLRRHFAPTPMSGGYGISTSPAKHNPNAPMHYHMALKRIHVDVTSPSLITFIKETLAPNSLEVLFLQDRRRAPGPPPVRIEAIFKGALKRHRGSLQKLLLDSSTRPNASNAAVPENTRWKQWALSTRVLLYITSGRMTSLRELSVSLYYRDWHTFLQRLPNIPQLRSLHIPHMAEHPVGTSDPRDLGLQISNIITLRPEIQLCYVGILSKCFEILESSGKDAQSGAVGLDGNGGGGGADSHGDDGNSMVEIIEGTDAEETSEDDDDDDDDDEEEDDDDDVATDSDTEDANAPATGLSAADPGVMEDLGHSGDSDAAESEEDDEDDDDDSFVEADRLARPKLRLREILFYDDKVAIFKARHGRL